MRILTYTRAGTAAALCRFCSDGLGAVQHGMLELLHAEQGSSLSHRTLWGLTLIEQQEDDDFWMVACLSRLASLAGSQSGGDDGVVVFWTIWPAAILILSTHVGKLSE